VASDIAGVETSVASVTAALGDTASSADVAALSAVTDLQVELDAIKAALDGLLSAGASLKRDIVISSSAELTLAESLIDATSTADYIIEGNVHIDATTAASYDNDLAAATTRISALTAKIATVLGAVTATTVSTSAALNMDKLTYVKGGLNISGKMPTVAALATTGSLTLDTDDGTYSLPTLVSAGPISIDISAVVSVTSIQLANVNTTDAATTATNQFVAVDADVNVGKAGLPATVTVKSLTAGGASYNTGTISTTGGDIALSAATVSGSTLKATGNITLSGATVVSATTITAAGNITSDHVSLAGAVTATSGGNITFSAATSLAESATFTANSGAGAVNLPKLTDQGKATTTLYIIGGSADLSSMTSNTGHLLVSGTLTSLSLPAMTNSAGDIKGAAVSTIDAPLLVLTTTATVDIKADSNHTYASINGNAAVVLNGSRTLVASDVSVLTLKAQTATITFDQAAEWNRLSSLTITGKNPTVTGAPTLSNGVTVGSANVSLSTVTMEGDNWLSGFTSNNSPMTSLTTAGKVRAFTVSGTTLTGLTFGHTEVTPGDASSIDITNTKVVSLDMSNSAIKTDYIYISDNISLTTVTMPAATNLAEPSASISITIHDNALTGAWTAAVAATGTSPYSEGSFGTTTPTGINNLSNYITAYTSQTSRTGSVSYTVEIDAASAAMTTNQGVSVILGDSGVVHYKKGGSLIANGVEVINTAGELGLLSD
jgi:filamentous hemagglutinin